MIQEAFLLRDRSDVVIALRKDAARRQSAYQAMFDEFGKVLSALVDHPRLRGDVEFLSLVDRLQGVEDSTEFFDRFSALLDYVDRVANAHGVANSSGATSVYGGVIERQGSQHFSDHADRPFERTRLQVR